MLPSAEYYVKILNLRGVTVSSHPHKRYKVKPQNVPSLPTLDAKPNTQPYISRAPMWNRPSLQRGNLMIKQPTKKTNFTPNSISRDRTFDSEKLSERKSKLETYVEVLGKLAHSKQGFFADAAGDTSEDYTKVLDHLAEQGLIRKRDAGNTTVYSTTRRGLSVLKYFSLLKTIPKIDI